LFKPLRKRDAIEQSGVQRVGWDEIPACLITLGDTLGIRYATTQPTVLERQSHSNRFTAPTFMTEASSGFEDVYKSQS
jgi:hypothetical protein